jgi:hypothetical protein
MPTNHNTGVILPPILGNVKIISRKNSKKN